MVTMRSAVHKSNCFHKKGHDADCGVYDTMYMVVFGIVQIFFSQVPNFHDLSWLSIIAAIMSFSYSSIAVGLSLARTISGERILLYLPCIYIWTRILQNVSDATSVIALEHRTAWQDYPDWH
jgi:hypothetical protein